MNFLITVYHEPLNLIHNLFFLPKCKQTSKNVRHTYWEGHKCQHSDSAKMAQTREAPTLNYGWGGGGKGKSNQP